ncbi:MAG: hypothetical protein PQJ61_11695 [Spirochaetales bacterium]|uniref:Uncharacterized protein n=1 Tax=Candidatus Thalassospirochaeta sargassi TaxID=3119039 RepID=A0AAJ1ML29_9SPIO|nr:hypothetical protein [Spirochaetales bacterium]
MKKTSFLLIFIIIAANGWSQTQATITVMDLAGMGVSEAEINKYSDVLTEIIAGSGDYNVIDRLSRKNLLKKTRFISGCLTLECQLEAGRYLAADEIVTGGIGMMNSQFVVNLCHVDMRSAEEFRAVTMRYDDFNEILNGSVDILTELFGIEDEQKIGFEENKKYTGAEYSMDEERIEFGSDKLEIVYDNKKRDYFWNGEIYSNDGEWGPFNEFVEDVMAFYPHETELINAGEKYLDRKRKAKIAGWSGFLGGFGGAMLSTLLVLIDTDMYELSMGLITIGTTIGTVAPAAAYIWYASGYRPDDFVEYYNENYPF